MGRNLKLMTFSLVPSAFSYPVSGSYSRVE
jgi:hypothetical protein